MKLSTKFIDVTKRHRLFILIIMSVSLIGIAGTTYATMSDSNVMEKKESSTINKTDKTGDKDNGVIADETISPQTVVDTSTDMSAQDSTKKPEQAEKTIKTTVQSSKPAPEMQRPVESLKVRDISASGSDVCPGDGNIRRIFLSYAYIHTNTYPGTVNWQIEALQNGEVSIVSSGVAEIAPNSGSYEITGTYGRYTKAMYDDSSIRIHTTAPNEIVSQWFKAEPLAGGSPCWR